MTENLMEDLEIAVLLPCYNEAQTIGDVVHGFRAALPSARIYVYDNNSTDSTALRAALAGATVVRERRQGKGNVVRRMFSDIEADIYIMADGDGTYAASDAAELIRTLITEGADMVVGTRRGVHADAGRQGHAFGNRIFNTLFRSLFGNLRPAERDRIVAVAETVGLAIELDVPAARLSHGQKQWLEIGMLLVMEPDLLLIDEPAAGMTDEETRKTGELLKSLSRERSVIVIEHDMEFVRQLCCTVTVLCEGKVLTEGDMDKVQNDPAVVEQYLGRAREKTRESKKADGHA